MSQFFFGIGTLIAKRTDIANAQPAFLGTVQEVSVDFDRTLVPLNGQYNLADAVGGGELKVVLKAKFANMKLTQFGDMFLNQTAATGSTDMAQAETGTPTGSPKIITTVNAATFAEDLGVFNADGSQMTPVASAPAINAYSVAAGVYTFNTAETGLKSIYYSYTLVSGKSILMASQLMGPLPTFALYLKEQWVDQGGNKKNLYLKFNSVVAGKVAMPFKNKDWMIEDLDMQAFADASRNLGTLNMTE